MLVNGFAVKIEKIDREEDISLENTMRRGMPFQGEEHRWTETLRQASIKLVEKKNMFEGWRK